MKHFLRSYDYFVKEVSQIRGISLHLLIKNRKISKTALIRGKTVKITPNFHQRAKIIRFFEFKILCEGSIFCEFLGTFSNFVTFSEKRKNSHEMGPKPRNYLKITKNIENNPKLIKKENRNRIWHIFIILWPKKGQFLSNYCYFGYFGLNLGLK